MQSETSLYVIYMVIVFLILTIAITSISILFFQTKSKMDKDREKELDLQKKKSEKDKQAAQIKQVINVVTTPITDGVLASYQPKNLIKMERMLYVAKWNEYFTPMKWIAFSMILGIIGLVLLIFVWPYSSIFALFIFAFFGIMPNFLLRNSYNNKTEALLLKFPETIRIIAGYLSAGLILPKAVLETSKGTSKDWTPLLVEFSAKCDTIGILDALDWFKNEVDIMEAREFFATVRLTIELGGSAKKGFFEQAEKIQQLLRDAMQKRIEKRKVWATVVQAPIFLCIIAAFALPTVGNMVDMFGSAGV